MEACVAERLTPLDLEVRCSRLVHHVVSLDMELYSTLLFTQVYKWVPDGIVLGGNLAMDLHLIQQGVAIFGGLLFATETENKLRLCAPLPLRMLCPTSLYISREKMRSLFHPNTAQRSIFFSCCNLFQGKRKEELVRKTRVNSERVYRIVLMPPGHPIILLKSH